MPAKRSGIRGEAAGPAGSRRFGDLYCKDSWADGRTVELLCFEVIPCPKLPFGRGCRRDNKPMARGEMRLDPPIKKTFQYQLVDALSVRSGAPPPTAYSGHPAEKTTGRPMSYHANSRGGIRGRRSRRRVFPLLGR